LRDRLATTPTALSPARGGLGTVAAGAAVGAAAAAVLGALRRAR
jgi:hypothetical protein